MKNGETTFHPEKSPPQLQPVNVLKGGVENEAQTKLGPKLFRTFSLSFWYFLSLFSLFQSVRSISSRTLCSGEAAELSQYICVS